MKKYALVVSILFIFSISSIAFGQTNKTAAISVTNDSMTVATWVLAISTLAIGLTTIITLIVTSMIHSKQNKIGEKQNELGMLLEIGRMLNDENSIRARKEIYEAFLNNSDLRTPSLRPYVERMRSEYSHVAYLIAKGYLKEDLFFDMFSGSLVRSWMALENDIKKERIERSDIKDGKEIPEEYFMKNFEDLVVRAREYRKKKGFGELTIRKLTS